MNGNQNVNGAMNNPGGGGNPGTAPANPRSQLPHVPSPDAAQLHWVNSELLLSLSEQPDALAQQQQNTRRSPGDTRPPSRTGRTPPESAGPSRHSSRFPSRRASRANSRAASPERGDRDRSDAVSTASAETYVHSSSTASRNLQGLFHMSMKPFTSLTSGLSLGHRSTSTSNLAGAYPHGHSHLGDARGSRSPSGASTPTSSGMNTPAQVLANGGIVVGGPGGGGGPRRHLTQDQVLLHRAFIETPDYEIASRGFLGGGVPPLSSFSGLPSYEEAEEAGVLERSRSEPDLAGRLHGRGLASIHGQLAMSSAGQPVTVPSSPPRRSLDT